MENKTILITGSTDGIGKQSAIELAQLGSRIIIHGRNAEKCESKAKKIISLNGNLDLGILTKYLLVSMKTHQFLQKYFYLS